VSGSLTLGGASQILGTTVVTPGGTWRVIPAADLAENTTTFLQIEQIDTAGNDAFLVGSGVKIIHDLQAPIALTIGNNGVQNEITPDIIGTAEPLATVTLHADLNLDGSVDTVVGSAAATASGAWLLTVEEDFPEGVVVLEVEQVDQAGNPGVPPAQGTVTIDRTILAPTIDVLAVTNNQTPTITGTGEVGATVTVLADVAADPNGVDGTPETEITDPANRPVVQADGTWSFVSAVTLTEGVIDLLATQIDEATNVSGDSDPASIEIDLTVGALVIDALGVTTNNLPTITGTGDPGATVVVLIDATNSGIANAILGPVVVAGDGSWAVTPPLPLVEGLLSIVAYQTDEAGTVSPLT
jgi:hypothetical protein